MLHQISDGVGTIAYAFLQLRCNEGYRLSLIEAEAPREPLLGQEACLWDTDEHSLRVRAGTSCIPDGEEACHVPWERCA